MTTLAYLFVLLGIAMRFMPHPWMFTPVAASLLFFGARGPRRMLWVPLALLIVSDVILTKYYWAYHMSWDQVVIWAWYAAILMVGTRLYQASETASHYGRGAGEFGIVSSLSRISRSGRLLISIPKTCQACLPRIRSRFPSSAIALKAICCSPQRCLRPRSLSTRCRRPLAANTMPRRRNSGGCGSIFFAGSTCPARAASCAAPARSRIPIPAAASIHPQC